MTEYDEIAAGETGVPIKAWTRGVAVEDVAVKQLKNVASLPFVHQWVAATPDVHRVTSSATRGAARRYFGHANANELHNPRTVSDFRHHPIPQPPPTIVIASRCLREQRKTGIVGCLSMKRQQTLAIVARALRFTSLMKKTIAIFLALSATAFVGCDNDTPRSLKSVTYIPSDLLSQNAVVAMRTDGDIYIGSSVLGDGTFGETGPAFDVSNGLVLARYRPGEGVKWVLLADGDSQVNALAVGPDGSLFAAGVLGRNATFAKGTPEEILVPPGTLDGLAFFARVREDGTLLWVRQLFGSWSSRVTAIAALPDGSALVAGNVGEQASLWPGPDELAQPEYADQAPGFGGDTDAFIARINADGTLAWFKRIGGSANEVITAISATTDGRFFINGRSGFSVTFARGEANETTLQELGDRLWAMKYIACYTIDGSLLWVRNHATSNVMFFDDEPIGSVVALPGGGALIAGGIGGPSLLAVGDPKQTEHTPEQGTYGDLFDGFVTRYDDDGSVDWIQIIRGSVVPRALAVASNGRFFLTGEFGNARFNPDQPTEIVLERRGTSNIFFAGYESDGAVAWAREASADKFWLQSRSMVAVGTSELVAAGRLPPPTATFGHNEENETTLAPPLTKVFIAVFEQEPGLAP